MKALKRKKPIGLYCLLVLAALVLIVPVIASISPTELTATLRPCESITETKEVHVDKPAKADVIFAFDLTSSMSGIITTAKSNAASIIAQLDALGVDVQYGVMSYMDYNGSYSSCGYSATYGGGSDYPYSLDQAVTSDSAAVVTAINALILGGGGDGPQDYTRIFYESYADPAVGWRTGAKRILVNFGDNVPHDCDLNEGVTGGTWSTGRDPGRNAVVDGYPPAGDDLKLLDVLQGMSDNGVVLLECHTADWVYPYPDGLSIVDDYWDYWTGITGGDVYLTGSGTLVDDVVGAVTTALTTPEVYGLHLEASSGFESWLESVLPPSYLKVEHCHTVTFEVTIHVPLGTDAGEYTFTISAVDEDGVSYGDQTVTITVITNQPPTADAGLDQTVEQDSHAGASVTLDGSGSTDPDSTPGTNDDIVFFDWWEGVTPLGIGETINYTFPLGSHVVTLLVTDSYGETDDDEVIIDVVDTTPPVITTGDMIEIWPPNHKYRQFNLSDCVVSVDDTCGGSLDVDAVGTILSIYSDEPEDAKGNGDGKTKDDIVILGPSSFKVRAEREGTGNGRVYGITFEVVDPAGNESVAICFVGVPHAQSGVPPIDDGPGAGYTVP